MPIYSSKKISSSQNSHKKMSPLHQNQPKEKKIKKRRWRKSQVRTRSIGFQEDPLSAFILSHSSQYFSLPLTQSIQQSFKSFQSFVHIKHIIGKQANAYKLHNYHQNAAEAEKYLKICRNNSKGKICQLRLNRKQFTKIFTCCMMTGDKNRQSNEFTFMQGWESLIMKAREENLIELNKFLSTVLPKKHQSAFDTMLKQIMVLCKLNSFYENQLESQILTLCHCKQDKLCGIGSQTFQASTQLQNRYCEMLMIKNLKSSFSENPLDFINYFRRKEIEQQNMQDDAAMPLLSSLNQLRNYLKLKKPKPYKSQDQSLKTACASCFSDICETYNPILQCPECGSRTHRLCHSFRNKCMKCKYSRKTTDEKGSKPYCFICRRDKEQGISIEILKEEGEEHYAHTFCLLTCGLWEIKDQKISYFQHLSTKPSKIMNVQKCFLCQKQTEMCFVSTCCGTKMHSLCAFLEGYSMQIFEDRRVQVRCCGDKQIQKRLSLQRKFRLNFQKMVYKQADSVLQFLESDLEPK